MLITPAFWRVILGNNETTVIVYFYKQKKVLGLFSLNI